MEKFNPELIMVLQKISSKKSALNVI